MSAVTTPPIDLYYWTTPNGWKASIMLEECGLPYRMIPVNIGKGAQRAPEFLSVSPNGKIPVIVDHDGPGSAPITIYESNAILQYLARKTGQFYPEAERERIAVDIWLFWQAANFGPVLGQTHHFRIYAPEKIPYAIERYTAEAARLYRVLDAQLAAHAFVAGDAYTIADIAVVTWAKLWERQGLDIADYPHVGRWLDAVKARPAVLRGFKLRAEPENAAAPA
ncbi:Glutathione S-transferase domain [Methylobacterium sp. 4-46]|uniref:glutathione S-transferase N-terminal domain-containing protein n=1 Tax=unclassified Methylobacterium TaxID=2615210 RepID=UPI000152C9D4|nr:MULTISPECIES: glutathione S-transferase N-terminal domain-containing protein [Methylobacterium]ACA18702.1 Glutathione S-transferase domain [Methylobacterium sp. 4-46]WFT77934.1 glutathione S-transferase N-terminal domain-containing protein [Methylobacterium nodulans]